MRVCCAPQPAALRVTAFLEVKSYGAHTLNSWSRSCCWRGEGLPAGNHGEPHALGPLGVPAPACLPARTRPRLPSVSVPGTPPHRTTPPRPARPRTSTLTSAGTQHAARLIASRGRGAETGPAQLPLPFPPSPRRRASASLKSCSTYRCAAGAAAAEAAVCAWTGRGWARPSSPRSSLTLARSLPPPSQRDPPPNCSAGPASAE